MTDQPKAPLSEQSNSPSGPRADVDWANATVTVKVPTHGTATTTTSDVELTLPQLAAALEAVR